RHWCRSWRRRSGRHQCHRCDESEAAPGHGHDEAVFPGSFSKRAAQQENTLAEIALFDDHVWPGGLHERRLFHQLAVVLHQVLQDVEYVGWKSGELALRRAKLPASGVEVKSSELVDWRRPPRAVHSLLPNDQP